MTRDASFIYNFVSDFWDLLPDEDRGLFAAYWHGLIQAVSDLYQKTFEADLATAVRDVQVFKTEHWNKYELNSSTADIKSIDDSLTLTGVTYSSLSKDSVLFDTFVLTNTNKSISFTDAITLFETNFYDLTYKDPTVGSVVVTEGLAIFVENRDYAVNYNTGQIARIEGGGILTGTTVSVKYMHPSYTEDLDYTFDRVNRKVARIGSGNIVSGASVLASYQYDNTSTLLMSGTGRIVAIDRTLFDSNQDFTGVVANRIITITSGVNAGTYTVNYVIASNAIKINEAMVADDNNAGYTINAFPYAINVDSKVASVPVMQDRIVDPTFAYREGVDYKVESSKICFRVPITTLWAPETKVDQQTVYRNFGVLIDFFRVSSEDYLNAVRGLWYTYWTGSTHENILRGLHILLGLPFASKDGTVSSISTEEQEILNVTSQADISTQQVRNVPSSASDTITVVTKRITFTNATGFDSFSSSDIGRKIRITNSALGNNGYYTIASIFSASTVVVAETPVSNETGSFIGYVYLNEDAPYNNPINHFKTSLNLFTHDDIGRYIRISSSTQGNDGDYEISAIVSPYEVMTATSFAAPEGVGGFVAKVIAKIPKTISLQDTDGVITTYTIPSGIDPIVEVGDSIEQFQRLTTGVRIIDHFNTPGFVELNLGRSGVQRFLTQYASRGTGNSDETKALLLLENNLWLPQVLTSAVSESTNIGEIQTFLNNLKAQWSEFVFSFADDFEETETFVENLQPKDIQLTIDLTDRLRNSWPNTSTILQYSGLCTISRETIRAPSGTVTISIPFYFSNANADFTSDDVGRILQITGSSAGNNGTKIIQVILSSTECLVSTPFFADESGGGLSFAIQSIYKLSDASADFLATATLVQPGDIIRIPYGSNLGFYEVYSVISSTILHIFEREIDGPFNVEESGTPYDVFSNLWSLNHDATNLLEGLYVNRLDGVTSGGNTLTVPVPFYSFLKLGVKTGMPLVINSGANLGQYTVATVSQSSLTISTTFPSNLTGQDFTISNAAIRRLDGPTLLEVLAI